MLICQQLHGNSLTLSPTKHQNLCKLISTHNLHDRDIKTISRCENKSTSMKETNSKTTAPKLKRFSVVEKVD